VESIQNHILTQKNSSSNVSQSVSVDDPALYTTTDSPTATTCVNGTKKPGSGFGNTAVNGKIYAEAALSFCSQTDVDRYKSIEIIFSQPMDTRSVEDAFSITSDSGQLPGPSPKGTFTWLSPTRLIFDPYTELNSRETYTIRILGSAMTTDGTPFKEFSGIFTTTHNYEMSHTLKQGNTTIALGSDKDVTFEKTAGNIILNSDFVKPLGAYEEVSSIVFNRLGNIDAKGNPLLSAKSICTSNCNFLGTPINLNSDAELQSEQMKIRDGGNTYYFEIRTKSGKIIRKYISFNYGTINKNPNDLIKNVASGVLDEKQMMKMLERLIEVFTLAKFKINGKTFVDFATENKSNVKNLTKCINNPSGYSSFNFTFIKNYGDNPNGGYCGPDGDEGSFVGDYSGILNFWGHSYFDMDVYIGDVSIPPVVSQTTSNVDAAMGINKTNELGIDLNSRKAYVTLIVVARNRSSIALLISGGSKFLFKTNVELNKNPTPSDLRLARAKSSLSIDSNGVLGLSLGTLKVATASSPDDTNFIIKPWVDNLAVEGMELVDSTSWAAELLAPITEMVADKLVPQLKAAITQVMLRDIVEKIAPNVLNSIVGTLKTPGVDISLPPYLPAGLANFPLNAKVQLSDDAIVRVDGNNKALISSIHLGITAKTPHINPHQHANTALCTNGCFVVTKDPNVKLINPINSVPFLDSSSKPGFLLSLHSDAVVQAAYHMWKNRVIDLNIDKTFIQSVNAYAGEDPLLKLTESILKTSAIMSIIAPGKTSLKGLDANGNLLPALCANDDIVFSVNPIMVPTIRLLDNANVDPNLGTKPMMNLTISELQMTVNGIRSDNSADCKKVRGNADNSLYKLSVIRINMNANATFKFAEFDNPNTPLHDRLNSLSIKLFTDGMAYSMDVLEGKLNNPYGLDPVGIRSALNPLVNTLVVPMVNSILSKVPLPDKVPFPVLTTSAGATCNVSAKTDHAIKFTSLSVPVSDATVNPYIYGRVELMGDANTDPSKILESTCR